MNKELRLAIEAVIQQVELDSTFRSTTKFHHFWFDRMVDQLASLDEAETFNSTITEYDHA